MDLVEPAVADALASELDDALAVRGVIPAGAFTAAPWPELDVLLGHRPSPVAGAARTWLEAEIERHLDLFASFNPDVQAWAARDLLRIIAGPLRAFEAVGALTVAEAATVRGQVVASLGAAGVDVGEPADPEAVPRPEWVRFLQDRPGPIPEPFVATGSRRTRLTVGRLQGAAVRLEAVSWSAEALDLEVSVGAATVPLGAFRRSPIHARVLDDTGVLHLGQPGILRREAAGVRLLLRPGFGPDVRGFEVRLGRGGEAVAASVAT